ncbi:hypothetical protein F4823DRAFT_560631 [Ustulina deusta]|nr:hypothetical protein F4823DRAFT_560631 [Ustulina deusta]
MPSTPAQTTRSSPTHLNFRSLPVAEPNPESDSRGIYTGESRVPFRERIQRMRRQKGVPKLVRRDTPIPRKRIARSPTSTAPRTPPMPTSLPVCPGAPRKGKVSELRRSSPTQADADEDVLLDREATARARGELIFPDIGGCVAAGRRSPLRNSWGPDQPSAVVAQLHQFALGCSEEDAGAEKSVR